MTNSIESYKSLPLFEHFYFLLIVIYTGMACSYTQVLQYYTGSMLAFLLPILLTYILLKRNRRAVSKSAGWMFCVVFIWTFVHLIKYGTVYPMTLFLFYNIGMAYIICRVYGLHIFSLYEKYVTILAGISLSLWFLCMLFPVSIPALINSLDVRPVSFSGKGTVSSTIILYSLSTSSDFLGIRNSGFSQEPGFYASILSLALFFNLARTQFNLKNRGFIILLISLITTQSTTGYIFLLLLLFFYTYNARRKVKLIIIGCSIWLLPLVFALPFMREKIEKYMFSDESEENLSFAANWVAEHQGDQATFVPQRFDGIAFEFMNFINDPILGYGIKPDNSFISQTISKNIYLSNGCMKLFAMYGVILAIFFLYYLYRASAFYQKYFKYKGIFFFVAIYICANFSYDFNTFPVFLSFWIFPLLYNTSQKELINR